MTDSATSLKSLMTDDDRNKLTSLIASLKSHETSLAGYKDTLANLLRRSYEITTIFQKLHRRTEQEIKDCEKILNEIQVITK